MVVLLDVFPRSWVLMTCALCWCVITEANDHCSRPLSRIVRNQLTEHFYSVFESKSEEPHRKCPLHLDRDLYRFQEGNKTQDYPSRWVCNFCGKAFLSEHYLDMHFDNRHSDELVKGTTVCLADFCDIFRCEVFENPRKDFFWEKKLCKEDRLTVRRRRCEALMRSCLPQGNLSLDKELEIYEAIGANTCALLNCKNYWKPPHQEIAAWKIILYAVITPFFVMGLIVYYYAIFDHYFGDYPTDISWSREEEEESFSLSRRSRRSTDLRKRYGGRPLMY